jgi:DNA repair photolyase
MTSPVEIRARTILRRMRSLDPWFLARCGMNLYRGCSHDCAYCDGRAEKYHVEGAFGSDVHVKVNAVDMLRRELGLESCGQAELWPAPPRRQGGFVLLGGGVGDSYQPAESRYGLARDVLELLAEHAVPVHILTKSTLVLRDVDIIGRIAATAGALVSFSLSSADNAISAAMEPGAPPPSERLRAIEILRNRGISAGVFLMPVLPFLTDSAQALDRSVAAAASAGSLYVLFGGMTLKPGRQKEHYLRRLAGLRPGLAGPSEELYSSADRWGNAPAAYSSEVKGRFARAAHRYAVPIRIPLALAAGVLDESEQRHVRAEHARAMQEMRSYLA